ncbi:MULTISPECIES: HlyC/CorC family transporter [unclassified Uliginosibacterium]|uniref:HlyC/CorC family transporter n=1 Tax=unclassified Uliginosibacterium TaxID=2621521 RepID=UPI000C7A9D0C|nr:MULTISPECIES: transporter associated domain-containing protein [unclassified Uliginosibacterium]MDO6386100.1 transporter associated domain-containing protein [Uliginosibacterium sp. 31-12]PLK49165.1 magnesium/cobalt efflux protein [Uliginosibacterium sp. TH139]
MDPSSSRPSILERLSSLLTREPDDREAFVDLLHSAHERKLFDADALSIIEGALQVADIPVREVMVPRAQMDVVHIEQSFDEILDIAISTAHSRFPVVGENRDDVLGVLLAKDLLPALRQDDFNLPGLIRTVAFVPETKRLNELLREFRVSRNHMAIVVDEYGGVSGLVTIEDVLEQIVGDIEDEYDFDEHSDDIVAVPGGRWRVKALTAVDSFNERFGSQLERDGVDTLGGLVLQHFGRVPARGEMIEIRGFRFKVLRADRRRVYTLLAEPLPAPDGVGG